MAAAVMAPQPMVIQNAQSRWTGLSYSASTALRRLARGVGGADDGNLASSVMRVWCLVNAHHNQLSVHTG
jgi:hypothetical protein